MAKPKLTETDLSWFDYGAYSDAALGALGLPGWVRVLADRLAIKCMISMGQHDLAVEAMQALQAAPLLPLGFEPPRIAGNALIEEPTVFFARVGAIKVLSRFADAYKLGGGLPFDFAWAAAEKRTSMGFATIHIDLRAKRSQLRADFDKLLKKLDHYQPGPLQRDLTGEAIFKEWIEHEYLPCFDLLLFAEIHAKLIPSALLALLLRVDDGQSAPADLLKAPRRCLRTFTPTLLHAMWRQRDGLVEPTPSSTGMAKGTSVG